MAGLRGRPRAPRRVRSWVLHDLTTGTWQLRHVVRATVQLAPVAVLRYVFILGMAWVRAMAVLAGLLLGFFYSTAYIYETAEHRAVKAGYPRGTAAAVRAEANADQRAAEKRRYAERWRSGPPSLD